PETVIAAMAWRNRKAQVSAETAGEFAQEKKRCIGIRLRIDQHRKRHAVTPFKEVRTIDVRIALRAFLAQIGLGEKPAKMAPAPAVPRIGEHVRRTVAKDQPG